GLAADKQHGHRDCSYSGSPYLRMRHRYFSPLIDEEVFRHFSIDVVPPHVGLVAADGVLAHKRESGLVAIQLCRLGTVPQRRVENGTALLNFFQCLAIAGERFFPLLIALAQGCLEFRNSLLYLNTRVRVAARVLEYFLRPPSDPRRAR